MRLYMHISVDIVQDYLISKNRKCSILSCFLISRQIVTTLQHFYNTFLLPNLWHTFTIQTTKNAGVLFYHYVFFAFSHFSSFLNFLCQLPSSRLLLQHKSCICKHSSLTFFVLWLHTGHQTLSSHSHHSVVILWRHKIATWLANQWQRLPEIVQFHVKWSDLHTQWPAQFIDSTKAFDDVYNLLTIGALWRGRLLQAEWEREWSNWNLPLISHWLAQYK